MNDRKWGNTVQDAEWFMTGRNIMSLLMKTVLGGTYARLKAGSLMNVEINMIKRKLKSQVSEMSGLWGMQLCMSGEV